MKLQADLLDILKNFITQQKSKNFDSNIYILQKNTYFFMQENARLQTLSKLPGGEITVTEISSAIKELKRRKAHGLDCIQNETLFLRTPTLHMYLTPLQRNYQHRQNFIFLENRSYHSYLQR